MAGAKFQYDESGTTFFYFLLSFEAIVLIPCTYYFYPRNSDKGGLRSRTDKSLCHCENCCIKRSKLREIEPWRRAKERFIKFLLLIGWLALFLTAYKCSKLQHDYVAYDPFTLLEIQPDASLAEIKKAYRRLSLVYHPDKHSGNEAKFMMIAKAYAALTDDEARKNWELYGNPDGPGATSFGIALPSWIIEKENSIWVLGLYGLVFMVALPVAVGIWWHRSAKFGTDAVLLDTTKLYSYYIYRSPHMIFRRVIMILAASMEFRRTYNAQIIERPSDNVEVPQLIKYLSNFGEKNKDRPLCYPYSLKARALIHAHLSRMKLSRNLEEDKQYIINKLPNLIQEFIQCVAQLTTLGLAGQISRLPHLETLECAMRLSACTVQALWDTKSPFLQLPHITDDILRHFTSRRRNIRSIKNLACMKANDRRAVLRTLSDDEYDDFMNVLSNMPVVDIEMKSEVIDDVDACTITAGAMVTVTVTLQRQNMSTLFDSVDRIDPVNGIEKLSSEVPASDASPMRRKQKPTKGRKKKTKDSNKGQNLKKRIITSAPEISEKQKLESDLKSESKTKDSDLSDCEIDNDDGDVSASDCDENDNSKSNNCEEDDDVEWEKFQSKVNKKDKILSGKSKQSHTVHCPFFPSIKDEYWWLYIADKKHNILKTAPYLVTNLVTEEVIELKFTAPLKPGFYSFSLVLRSDSYIDFDVIKTIKLDVKEAKVINVSQTQWDISENEEKSDHEEESAVEDSDLATDDETE